ncbi:hypothetical protein IFT84_02455 [Rhizobium sp. CFBP 8762]|uniref:hypothetical protein n=1 Tax=Rhizobium sp. CFBP 8762 TaxID=2775279 RepID=UPI001782CF72|nr:hypothetical protein [Rhizobium sp. CFBP 8762]MBD8553381.1 hypothetical protein [Rhizobium sp. CFBP 8762]
MSYDDSNTPPGTQARADTQAARDQVTATGQPPAQEFTAKEARQGRRGWPVLMVLVAALALIFLAWGPTEWFGKSIDPNATPASSTAPAPATAPSATQQSGPAATSNTTPSTPAPATSTEPAPLATPPATTTTPAAPSTAP